MQIEWVPYDRLPQEFLPEQYGQQIILVLAFTYLLCIAQAVPHDLGVLSGRKLFFCRIVTITLCCLKLMPSMIVVTKTLVAREERRIGLKYMVYSSKHGMIICNTCMLTEIVMVMLEWCSNLYTYSNYI